VQLSLAECAICQAYPFKWWVDVLAVEGCAIRPYVLGCMYTIVPTVMDKLHLEGGHPLPVTATRSITQSVVSSALQKQRKLR
jgi:hypothetical protein